MVALRGEELQRRQEEVQVQEEGNRLEMAELQSASASVRSLKQQKAYCEDEAARLTPLLESRIRDLKELGKQLSALEFEERRIAKEASSTDHRNRDREDLLTSLRVEARQVLQELDGNRARNEGVRAQIEKEQAGIEALEREIEELQRRKAGLVAGPLLSQNESLGRAFSENSALLREQAGKWQALE